MSSDKTTDKDTSNQPSETVRNMTKVIQKGMNLDNKTGIITANDGLYKECLPDGLNMDTIRTVHTHDHDFIAASALAVSNIGLKAMMAHSELDEVTAHVPLSGRNATDISYVRNRVFPNIKDSSNPNAEPIVAHGVLTVKTHFTSAGNTGEIARVRQWAKAQAAESLLAKK